MSAVDKSQLTSILTIHVGTQAATASIGGPAIPKACKMLSCKLVNEASLATDDTNYLIVELKIGSTVLGSFSTKTTTPGKLVNEALVALVASSNILGTNAPYSLAAGDQLKVVATKNGTGVPTNMAVYCELQLL